MSFDWQAELAVCQGLLVGGPPPVGNETLSRFGEIQLRSQQERSLACDKEAEQSSLTYWTCNDGPDAATHWLSAGFLHIYALWSSFTLRSSSRLPPSKPAARLPSSFLLYRHSWVILLSPHVVLFHTSCLMVSLYLRENTFLDKLHYISSSLAVFLQPRLLSLDNLGMLNGATIVLSQMKLQCDSVFYYHFVLSLSVFKDMSALQSTAV